ncbi:MAG: hypothetical protein GYA31_01455 [Parcubacteria group bacterium]|nr:hypothetical protein [Parcubacteria group bacterium]
MKSIIVYYHIKDNDGLGSAWSAWLKFKNEADYFGLDYHFDINFDYKDKKIYFLDIHPSVKKIELLRKNKNYLVLIDHHLSSKPILHLFHEYKFSIKHSAAILSFQYFFPHKKIPKILKYIEDIDIWKLKIPHSREINNAIDFYDGDFTHWNKLARGIENLKTRKQYIKIGQIISRYQDTLIEKIINKAKLVHFEDKTILAVNSPILISEVGNALVKRRPPLAIVWSEINGKIWCSLRSNGECDVSKIAEKYQGGGQKGAAAFYLNPGEKIPWQEIK